MNEPSELSTSAVSKLFEYEPLLLGKLSFLLSAVDSVCSAKVSVKAENRTTETN